MEGKDSNHPKRKKSREAKRDDIPSCLQFPLSFSTYLVFLQHHNSWLRIHTDHTYPETRVDNVIRDVVAWEKLLNQLGRIIIGRKGKLNHRLQSTILEPRHTEIIVEKLANVHSQGRRSRVLDVGAGTGAFAFALATAQPFADVTAIDIDWSNFVNTRSHHGNVDLQTVDLTQPLPFESGYFDVVHLRSMHLSIPYYTTLVERLARVLSAGGLLVMAESEPTYLSTTGQPIHRSLRQWDAAVREAYAAQQIDVDLPSNLLSCLSTSAVFATPVYTQELGIPCGSYVRGPFSFSSPPDTPGSYITSKSDPSTLIQIGSLHSQVLASNMRSMMPVLMAYGYSRDDLEMLVEDCVALLSGPGSTFYQRLFAFQVSSIAWNEMKEDRMRFWT